MKVSINTFYFPNSNQEFISAHKKVMEHWNVPVNYYEQVIRHGDFMNSIMENTDAEIVGFLDIDCIPLSGDAIMELVQFVGLNKSIAGNVQATNHLPPMTHTFIAPSCFFIYKPLWVALGKPSFLETQRSDVAEELCYIAEQNGVRMKAFYPTHFEREPEEGVWRLNNYGLYGVGTVFANKFYHLFQSRMETNVQLFIKRCKEVVKGTFTTKGMFESTNFDFQGRIACFPAEQQLYQNVKAKLG